MAVNRLVDMAGNRSFFFFWGGKGGKCVMHPNAEAPRVGSTRVRRWAYLFPGNRGSDKLCIDLVLICSSNASLRGH